MTLYSSDRFDDDDDSNLPTCLYKVSLLPLNPLFCLLEHLRYVHEDHEVGIEDHEVGIHAPFIELSLSSELLPLLLLQLLNLVPCKVTS